MTPSARHTHDGLIAAAPPRVNVLPPIDQWALNPSPAIDRSQLVERINARAQRLGTAPLRSSGEPGAPGVLGEQGASRKPGAPGPEAPLIATGHQASLWHPGILAKDIAMDLAARRLGAQRLHMVVDQDANETLRLAVPFVHSDELRVAESLLFDQMPGVATGFHPPADTEVILEKIRSMGVTPCDALTGAFEDLPDCRSLAEQLAVVLARLKRPYAGDTAVMMVSDLAGLDVYESVVSQMLNDALRCAQAYNQAIVDHPDAGMTAMVVGRELVELPLWAVAWRTPRRRVFVDLADSTPMFVYDDGEPIDRDKATLLPRALLLTAVMRRGLCDLFIHGTGGYVYDRATEAWWRTWAREELAPIAQVTADMYLELDAPVADRAGLDRAVWLCHHLPNNLDRALGLKDGLAERKRELLAHMDDDRDRARRRSAFREIHSINRELSAQHPGVINQAEQDLRRAQVGVGNARTAGRRDWCFALYPPAKLKALRRTLAGEPATPGGVE